MKYKVSWTQPAQKDLREIIHFIALERKQVAHELHRIITDKGNSLKQNPLRGRKLPELMNYPHLPYREFIHNPWRLIYRINKDNVEILAVLDSRRNLRDIIFEKITRAL